MVVRDPVVRPRDEPSGQVAPASHDRSSQTSSPAAPPAMVAHVMPRVSVCRAIVRPPSVAGPTGWVSPGLKGPKLYMVSFRTCPDCVRFKSEEYPGLHKANVDTRLIEIARADRNGVPKSTPAERATVAELWVNRSWALSEKWDATPVEAWTAKGIAPADGDVARSAVIEAGRKTVELILAHPPPVPALTLPAFCRRKSTDAGVAQW